MTMIRAKKCLFLLFAVPLYALLASTASSVALADETAAENASDSAGAEPQPEGLSLADCIRIAVENNYDLKQAQERIKRQYHVVVQARSELIPDLGVRGDFTFTDQERIPEFQDGGSFGTSKDWHVDARLEQAVYSGGKAIANLNRAKLQEQAAQEDFEAVLSRVLLETTERYYDALLARAQVDVERENVSLFEEQLRSEKSRLEAGTVSEFNVLRADVDLANSRTPFIRARNRVKIAREELRRVLGIGDLEREGSDLPAELHGTMSYEPFPLELPDALQRATKQRPELRRASTLIQAEEQGVDVERADFFPSLTLFGAYGADHAPFSDNVKDEFHGWTAGAELSWNIFDGFGTSARVGQANVAVSQARLSQAQLRQDINLEVRRTHSSLVEADELVRVSSKVVEQAAESLRLAQTRYDTGAATYLETLDRQVALTQARTNQVQALHDYNVVVARMRYAIGELQSAK